MKISLQRWFMPWRWGRWAWAVVAFLLFPAYILSAAPVDCITRRVIKSTAMMRVIFTIYEPAWKIAEYSDAISAILDFEVDVTESVLGPEQDW